jgi:tetratricopeptide (TPR) repeat protein
MAQRDFERAAEWMPRNAAAFDALAGTKTKQGEWLAATHDWERALEIDSYHPRHLLYYAQALLYASSEIVTVPQPEAPPNLEAPEARCNADAGKPMSMKWNGMHVPRTAVMWRHQCRVMEVLDRALLYGADDSDVRYVRGFHFMTRLARPDLAAEEFRRSVELEPRNSENWNLYGQALYEAEPCRAVPVMIHYLRMCTVVSTCQSDELVPIWLDDIVKNAGCSDEVTSAAAQYKPFWEKRSSAEPASGR